MYSPQLGRFLNPDPLTRDPTILSDNNWFGDRLTVMRNAYAYVNNNPVNYNDPSGLKLVPVEHPINKCNKQQWANVLKGFNDVCNDIAGKLGNECLGPKLRQCLQNLCSGQIEVECWGECADKTLCGKTTISNQNGDTLPPNKIGQPPCVPLNSQPHLKVRITICANNLNGKWCSSGAGHNTILHELVHACNFWHNVPQGGNVPGDINLACELSCYKSEVSGMTPEQMEQARKCPCECP